MATSTVLKAGWFYLPTFLKDDKYEPKTGTCTLIVRHYELREGPSGRRRVKVDTDALDFPDEDAMAEWIEEHDAEELPPEADGNPRYVPAEFKANPEPESDAAALTVAREKIEELKRLGAVEVHPDDLDKPWEQQRLRRTRVGDWLMSDEPVSALGRKPGPESCEWPNDAPAGADDRA